MKQCKCMRAFRLSTTHCRVCGCTWSKHIKVTHEYFKTTRKMVNTSVFEQIETQEAIVDKIRSSIDQMELLLHEYTDELVTV